MARNRQDVWVALGCSALAALAIALTVPLAESGVNDDWSFTKTALDLATTGKLLYNGWATPILGAQAYWGALFIKLFGFSFLATRLSTIVLAIACAPLLYVIHRRDGLPRSFASIGTLTVVLSPLFIPHATSFMTEVPAFFLLLVSIYGYIRVAEVSRGEPSSASSSRTSETIPSRRFPANPAVWLCFASVAGFLAGTARQICWIAPIAFPLYLGWRCRIAGRRRVPLLWLTLSSTAAFLGACYVMRWFYRQPYAIHDDVQAGLRSLPTVHTVLFLLAQAKKVGLTLTAVTLPVLVLTPSALLLTLRKTSRPLLLCCLCFALVVALVMTSYLYDSAMFFFPWLPNTFTITPYSNGITPMPPDAVTLNLPWSVWTKFGIGVFALAVCTTLLVTVIALSNPVRLLRYVTSRLSVATGLFAVFAVAYVPILLLKSLVPGSAGIFDRYLLFLLPLVTMAILQCYYRLSHRTTIPIVAWSLLILLAFYGIAQTHDNFAHLRARTAAAKELEARGIPRTRIMGGWEYDSWTQITTAGYYSDLRIKLPPVDFVAASPPPFVTHYSFWRQTPVVHPDYVVCAAPHHELTNASLPPFTYSAWLPPFRRSCVVQQVDPTLRLPHARSTIRR